MEKTKKKRNSTIDKWNKNSFFPLEHLIIILRQPHQLNARIFLTLNCLFNTFQRTLSQTPLFVQLLCESDYGSSTKFSMFSFFSLILLCEERWLFIIIIFSSNSIFFYELINVLSIIYFSIMVDLFSFWFEMRRLTIILRIFIWIFQRLFVAMVSD